MMDVVMEPQHTKLIGNTLAAMNNENADERPSNPVLQIISISRIESKSKNFRFNVMFGDSVHFQRGSMHPDLNHLVFDPEIFKVLSTVTLTKYDIHKINGVPHIIVIELSPKSPPLTEILGNPVDINDESSTYRM